MELLGSYELLERENEKLQKENGELKLMVGLIKTNMELRSQLGLPAEDRSADSAALSNSQRKAGVAGQTSTLVWDETLEEGRFSSHLQKMPHKTSSPLNLSSPGKESLAVNSHNENVSLDKRSRNEPLTTPDMTDPVQQSQERVVGEIAFQLDRRILSYVFSGQTRLYGFTVFNIPDKIIQVSTNLVSGKVDHGFRAHMTHRYFDLMEKLRKLGYSMTLHPHFAEFIVNSYGILKQRPEAYSTEDRSYSDPEILRKLVIDMVPSNLLKDILRLFSCLCYMAKQDGKPLFIW
ncbi:speriolin-like protein isoform X1 [Lepisosteus oculatus]|uniref:speriolin-like protein isoform X1 n=1 Tax=Lepisosteus oculatus TaxID=7918 RepID=UPI0035F50EC7